MDNEVPGSIPGRFNLEMIFFELVLATALYSVFIVLLLLKLLKMSQNITILK